ncbi:hypothetical protein BLNAU_20538 [Blattamonas nauphoetae]|uniref:RRM domain-containing protein n=1 Tax=Blattamonas nauphoetae TaxID=2049346 RepID=A0ABQ9X0R1_9EUKA|nr:hypothetical protein BLNAU_20538 [Blattamonas nauphoetae]
MEKLDQSMMDTPKDPSIYVCNIPSSVTEADIKAAFSVFGTIVKSSFFPKKPGPFTEHPMASVIQFTTLEECYEAIDRKPPITFLDPHTNTQVPVQVSLHDENNTLYLINLPFKMTEQQIQEVIESVAEIPVERFVLGKRFDGKSKGFGWATYSTHKQALTAKAALNDYPISERFKLAVSFARRRGVDPRLVEKIRTLYVKNIPLSISSSALKELFEQMITQELDRQKLEHPPLIIDAVIIPHDHKTQLQMNHAFVHFASKDMAIIGYDLLQGYQMDRGSLYVEWAEPRENRQANEKEGALPPKKKNERKNPQQVMQPSPLTQPPITHYHPERVKIEPKNSGIISIGQFVIKTAAHSASNNEEPQSLQPNFNLNAAIFKPKSGPKPKAIPSQYVPLQTTPLIGPPTSPSPLPLVSPPTNSPLLRLSHAAVQENGINDSINVTMGQKTIPITLNTTPQRTSPRPPLLHALPPQTLETHFNSLSMSDTMESSHSSYQPHLLPTFSPDSPISSVLEDQLTLLPPSHVQPSPSALNTVSSVYSDTSSFPSPSLSSSLTFGSSLAAEVSHAFDLTPSSIQVRSSPLHTNMHAITRSLPSRVISSPSQSLSFAFASSPSTHLSELLSSSDVFNTPFEPIDTFDMPSFNALPFLSTSSHNLTRSSLRDGGSSSQSTKSSDQSTIVTTTQQSPVSEFELSPATS